MGLRLSLMGQTGETAGQRSVWTLSEAGGRIGRARDNDWVLSDPERYVSAHHARIDRRADRWWITDLSTNGTFINGSSRALGRDSSHALEDGDRIRMGSLDVVAEIVDDQEAKEAISLESPALDEAVDVSSLLSAEETGRRPGAGSAPAGRVGPADQPDFWPGLVDFCKGAGIDPYALPAARRNQVLQEAGQALREMVLGLQELSRSRAEFTREVGISTSQKQRDATSPLMQVSGTEEALLRLLAGSSDTRVVDEVRSQFARTRHYQQSVVVALREALSAMLERLDPDELERQFGGTTRVPGKAEDLARYWSRYRDMHRSVANTDETGLPVIFVQEFARTFQTLAAVGLRATPKSGESN